jgi:hypothetical protein
MGRDGSQDKARAGHNAPLNPEHVQATERNRSSPQRPSSRQRTDIVPLKTVRRANSSLLIGEFGAKEHGAITQDEVPGPPKAEASSLGLVFDYWH